MLANFFDTNPDCTWYDICEALESRTVKRNDISKIIKDTKCSTRRKRARQYSDSGNFDSEIEYEAELSCSDQGLNLVSSSETSLTTSFVPSVAKQSSDNEQQMRGNLKEISIAFANLVTSTRNHLNVSVPTLSAHLLSLRTCTIYSVYKGNNALFREEISRLEKAKNIDEIFAILSYYWSFLDYDLLENIIELYAETQMDRFQNYVQQLKAFLESWKVEKPYKISNSSTEMRKQYCFTLSSDTVKNYRDIKYRIAKIFDLEMRSIILYEIQTGCIKLVFLFPRITEPYFHENIDWNAIAGIVPRVSEVAIIKSPDCKRTVYKVRIISKWYIGILTYSRRMTQLTKRTLWRLMLPASNKKLKSVNLNKPRESLRVTWKWLLTVSKIFVYLI